MAVTVSYSLDFVRNLDLTTGPAVSASDAVGLDDGGFGVIGGYFYTEASGGGSLSFTATALEVFDGTSSTSRAAADRVPDSGIVGAGSDSVVARLGNGNLVVAGQLGYAIYDTEGGTVRPPAEYSGPNAGVGQSVAALSGGGFVVLTHASSPGITHLRIFNEAGVELRVGTLPDLGPAGAVVAGLDDGGFAVAFIENDGSVWTAVYNANGTERRAAAAFDIQGTHRDLDITATDGGFAIVYADSAFDANNDIGLARFYSNGNAIDYVILSGPETIDATPKIDRLPHGLLAVAWNSSAVGPADSETRVALYDPATVRILDVHTVTSGEPLSDDTDRPVLAATDDGTLAVFHTNVTDNDAEGEQLQVVRRAEGDGDADTIFSNDVVDIMNGGGGGDYLDGAGNDDVLNGDSGDDFLVGGAGDDVLNGGADKDTVRYRGTSGPVTVDLNKTTQQNIGGGEGRDTLIGIENVDGGNFADTLIGTAGANVIDGEGGADRMTGGGGDDTYVVENAGDKTIEAANGGIDTVISTGTAHTLQANVENLSIVYSRGSGLTVQNGTGNTLANTIRGNDGLNTLDGAGGADRLIGGLGNDTYILDNAGDQVVELADEGTDTVRSSVTVTLGANVENLTLTGAAAINGTGNTLANLITGNNAANVLNGGGGADRMSGGLGNDTYVTDGGDVISETSASGGTDLVQSSATVTLGANLENLTLTGTAAINGTGNTLANLITGNNAANVLNGGGGADRLSGGLGNDTYITDGGDVISETSASGGTDLVRSSVTLTLGANLENLTLTGPVAINGTGNSLANIITGNNAANVLNGGGGADRLIGGLGNDTYVTDGGDVISETSATGGTDLVQSSATLTLGTNLENLTLTGSGAINGTGNAGNNLIVGNAAANVLTGLAGLDQLSGGLGADTFQFRTLADSTVGTTGRDIITDFNRTQGDRIDLRFIDANVGTAANDAFSYIGAAAFSGQAGELRAIASGADTLVLADVNGDRTADFSVVVRGRVDLQTADFML